MCIDHCKSNRNFISGTMGSSTTIDFFSALDVDDDVNELLELQTSAAAHHRPASTASSSARDLLLAQVRSMQQQQQQHAQATAAAMHGAGLGLPSSNSSRSRSAATTNALIDGLMDDEWNTGDLFDGIGSPDTHQHPPPPPQHQHQHMPLPPPPVPGPPVPVGHTPTMADLAAAYWHGRATGAMASASGAAAAAVAGNINPANSLSGLSFGAVVPAGAFPPNISSSASALTANLATSQALAATNDLNATLSQWLSGGDVTAAAAAAPAPSTAASAMSSFGGSSSWDPMAMGGYTAAPAPTTGPSYTAGGGFTYSNTNTNTDGHSSSSYLAQLLAGGSATTAATTPTTQSPLSNNATTAQRDYDATTAQSLFQSRLALARANAATTASTNNAYNHMRGSLSSGSDPFASSPSAATGAAPYATRNNTTTTTALTPTNSSLLSSLLNFEENILDDGADSIGTVDPLCDTDDEEDEGGDMPLLEDIARLPTSSGGQTNINCNISDNTMSRGSAGMASSSSSSTSVSALLASTSNNENTTERNSTSTTASSTTASAAPVPPRRSRRQAAVRGLERISTALATHGMGGSDSPDNITANAGHHSTSSVKTEGASTRSNNTKGGASRKKAPTIIPKPSNKCLKSNTEKEEAEEAKKKAEDEANTPLTCCICLDEPTHDELANINGCTHPFCFTCIEKWADQENTCPLCKARFTKIEKVNQPKKRKGGPDGPAGGDGRSSKRVRNRDQRSDIHSFVNPLEGIFASMEANGTWPTHIAQLLFTGLGASTFGGGLGSGIGRPPRPSGMSGAAAAASAAAARRQAPNRFRYQPPGSRPASSAAAQPLSSLLRQRQQNYTTNPFSSSTRSSSLGANPFALPSPPQRAAAPVSSPMPFSVEASPWSASASVSVTLGSQGFAGRSSSASTTSYQSSFPNPPRATSRAATATARDLGLTSEEEEDLLSTLSPSSYIRRLHRELEGGSRNSSRASAGQYQFNTSSSTHQQARAAARRTTQRTPGVMHPSAAPSPRDNPFGMFSSAPSAFGGGSRASRNRAANASRPAGRTVETALEIDSDSDDDVVEIIDVEALI